MMPVPLLSVHRVLQELTQLTQWITVWLTTTNHIRAAFVAIPLCELRNIEVRYLEYGRQGIALIIPVAQFIERVDVR